MALASDTIALPLIKGLDVQTDARLLDAPGLLEAENTQFSGGGAKKRRGHVNYIARGPGDLELSPVDPEWVYGVGLLPADGERAAGDEGTRYWNHENPELGFLQDVFTRDNETVVWDGFRLHSYLPSETGAQAPRLSAVSGQAVLPLATVIPLAKNNEHQGQPEYAHNTIVRAVAWINEDAQARYHVYDITSQALIASGTLTITTADYIRIFTMGDWVHILVRDTDDNKAKLFSINGREPGDVTFRSMGEALHFDLWKLSETEAVLASTRVDGIHVAWLTSTGAGSATRTTFTFTPTVTSAWTLVSITWAIREDQFGLAWYSAGEGIGVAVISQGGEESLEALQSANTASTVRLTLSARFVQTADDAVPFVLFWDNGTDLRSAVFYDDEVTITIDPSIVRYRQKIASRAFRVGDRVFLWAGHSSTLQSSWFCLDEGLLPVGRMDFAVANVDTLGSNGRVGGVNWLDGEPYEAQSALSYKLRVAPNTSALALTGIYTEPSIQGVTLEFLPRLSAAQAGRATYIAGAQVWSYDGSEVVESGFHTGPEPTLAPSNGGALTALGTYSYRVDLCYRNAQNEEVRSLSILSDSIELTGSQTTITVTIPTVLTRRTDSYFLIFRNAMSSGVPLTEWWLLNSRDPDSADYRANDLSVSTVTFIDAGATDDTDIQTRELHPAVDTYLQPISPPACEILASGRDRLWASGGELPYGVVAPSRLFDPGEVPLFNPYLNLQVDRSVQPITAIGFVGEVAAFFRERATYILDSDGPDNIAQGLWNPPRLALSDLGATSRYLARVAGGLLFLGPSGFRLLGPGGSLSPIGIAIDSAAKDFTPLGVVINERDQEVRFYGSAEAGTYVVNYLYGTWTHWTCGGNGVALNSDGYAVIARDDGELWIETPGVWKDGAATYTHRIRTSWLHGGNIGDFHRVRNIEGLGRFADLENKTHNLRLELYYDEREFWEERVEWSLPDDDTNQDTWGAATWGAGVWGDTTATISNLEDLTWDWDHGPARQKCAVFSIALEDVNTDGPGFILSGFGLELARKQGLNKLPGTSGTGTYR